MKNLFLLHCAFSLVFLILSHNSFAATSEGDIIAGELSAQDVAAWLSTVPKKPKKIGIFNVQVSSNMETSFATYFEAQMVKSSLENKNFNLISCSECRTPKVMIRGDSLVVSRGSPDKDTFIHLGKQEEVGAFLTIEISKTQLSLFATAILYQTSDGQILASETFKNPDLDFSESATQFMFGFGPGVAIGGKDDLVLNDNESAAPRMGADLHLMSEVGFGKAGINLGGVFNGRNKGRLYYLIPTLGWRGRFGGSGISTLKTLGIGYAVGLQTSGISPSIGYYVFLGSYVSVGLKGTFLIPLYKGKAGQDNMDGFMGFEIGFNLGR